MAVEHFARMSCIGQSRQSFSSGCARRSRYGGLSPHLQRLARLSGFVLSRVWRASLCRVHAGGRGHRAGRASTPHPGVGHHRPAYQSASRYSSLSFSRGRNGRPSIPAECRRDMPRPDADYRGGRRQTNTPLQRGICTTFNAALRASKLFQLRSHEWRLWSGCRQIHTRDQPPVAPNCGTRGCARPARPTSRRARG